MELDKKIIENGRKQVESIINEAHQTASKEAENIINEAKLDNLTKYNKLKKETQTEIKMKSKSLFFEIKQAELLARQKVIEEIFYRVAKRINALEGEELLTYVTNQIRQELNSLIGDIDIDVINPIFVMHTNKEEYCKYVAALSSEKNVEESPKEKIIHLDKLRNPLGIDITLSNVYVDIDGGFILYAQDFDLNFSTAELIKSLMNKYEKEIKDELFS